MHKQRIHEHFRCMGGMAFTKEMHNVLGKGEEYFGARQESKPKRGYELTQVEPDSCLVNMSATQLKDFPTSLALTQFLWTKQQGFELERPLAVWAAFGSTAMLHPCANVGATLRVYDVRPDELGPSHAPDSSKAQRHIEACELFHTSAVEAEMFSGMSKTEKSRLQELLTLAVAEHGHRAVKLIAAHETDEQRRRHKPLQVVGRFSAGNIANDGSRPDQYFVERKLKMDQTRATGVAVLPVKNLSSKSGRNEQALYYVPMAKYNAEDKPADAEVFSFPLFVLLSWTVIDKGVILAMVNITL
jgi:hypothetical protein